MILALLLVILAIFISLTFAYLSLGDYQEYPSEYLHYSLFLIHAPNLTKELLLALHKSHPGLILSFEKLIKGEKEALVIFGPKDLIERFDTLNPVELEDYIQKFAGKIFSWELIREDTKRKLLRSPKIHSRTYLKPLKALHLRDDEQVWLQVVVQGCEDKDKTYPFQATVRLSAVVADSVRRFQLAKRIEERFKAETDLVRKKTNKTSPQVFLSLKKRSLVPSEIMDFRITAEQLLTLVK